MITATTKRSALPRTSGFLLILSVLSLWSLAAPAGELSEVPDGLRLELNLPDLAGQQRSLEKFAGKVLLVNFWASWCRPCIEEMPSIQRLAREMHGKPFAVIGVNVGETERRVQATVKRLEIDFPVLLDKNSAVFESWGATVLPTTYVLDGNGRVRHVGRGPLEWDRVDIIDLLGDLTEQQHLPK